MPTRLRSLRAVLPAVALIAGLLLPAAAVAATDTDRDGLPNAWERSSSHTNPHRADTDRDGIPDGREDPDHDGRTNAQELQAGTDPWRANVVVASRLAVRAPTGPGGVQTPGRRVSNAVGTAPTLPGAPFCPVFPASNVWNTRIDGRAVAANSATMIATIGLTAGSTWTSARMPAMASRTRS